LTRADEVVKAVLELVFGLVAGNETILGLRPEVADRIVAADLDWDQMVELVACGVRQRDSILGKGLVPLDSGYVPVG
jgi:hypothetical protein